MNKAMVIKQGGNWIFWQPGCVWLRRVDLVRRLNLLELFGVPSPVGMLDSGALAKRFRDISRLAVLFKAKNLAKEGRKEGRKEGLMRP